jgi:hypothetical protein
MKDYYDYGWDHISNGGTAITNFDPKKDLNTFQLAIKMYGKGNIYIEEKPFGENAIRNDYALHIRNKEPEDLQTFWYIVGELRRTPKSKAFTIWTQE